MAAKPTLHLTVVLPGVGKTTLARRVARENGAVRLTPDEWMIPLFGDPEANGKRDALEGRLLWLAHEVLRTGGAVVLDFGCWAADERWAVRAVAEHAGARFRVHFLDLSEPARRHRAATRWEADPESTFEIPAEDHERFAGGFQRPSHHELNATRLPEAPDGFRVLAHLGRCPRAQPAGPERGTMNLRSRANPDALTRQRAG